MKLQIAGGCGEHGRNCFYVIGEDTAFLVDCGQMDGEQSFMEMPGTRSILITVSISN